MNETVPIWIYILASVIKSAVVLFVLLTAVAYNPFAIGIGLDEDTAAFIGPDEVVEIEGSGSVTLVDPSEVSFSSIGTVEDGQPACMLGLRLHLLVPGATFNLKTRVASASALTQTKE